MVVILISNVLLYVFSEGSIARFDEDHVTPSDFTVMAYNIPLDLEPSDLHKWLTKTHQIKGIRSITF